MTIGRINLPCFDFILECFNHVFDYIEKRRKVKSRVEIHPLPEGRGILSTTSDNIKKEYPNFKIEECILNDNMREIFNHVKNPVRPHSVEIHMDGSDFQIAVWNEIMKIPTGKTASYTEIAESLGKPQSVRAVATACSKNKIAVLVPCHRVVSKSNKNTGYRWDVFRKKRLLDIEKEKQF